MESTRFPGKPLALINGKPMIKHVYDAAHAAHGLSGVSICTDPPENIKYCIDSDLPFIKPGPHQTGSDRINEASSQVS